VTDSVCHDNHPAWPAAEERHVEPLVIEFGLTAWLIVLDYGGTSTSGYDCSAPAIMGVPVVTSLSSNLTP
jgi:hypothetical protein